MSEEALVLTVNIFGGRGVGKTTVAMHVVAELRWHGVRASLFYGPNQIWDWSIPDVIIRVFHRNPETLTPHEASELGQDSLSFLVLRRKDYSFPVGFISVLDDADELERRRWEESDARLESVLREGQVRYKSLPGVRPSVPYIVARILQRLGVRR